MLLTKMHRIDLNQSALHSSRLGASNDVSTVILGHMLSDLSWSEESKILPQKLKIKLIWGEARV